MNSPFLQSLFVQPQVVMGKQLLPFSAYHAAALSIVDSPLLEKGAGVRLHDLAFAVYICIHDSETGPRTLFPEPDLKGLEKWGRTKKGFDLHVEIASMEQHLDDYMHLPCLVTDDMDDECPVNASDIPAPFQAVTTVLQGMGGITRFEAWNMPYSELISYKCGIAEDNGHKVMSHALQETLSDIEDL